MKPLRTLAAASVLGAASLGGGLFAELFGVSDNVASGQAPMARVPSLIAGPSVYPSTSDYAPLPGYYPMPAYSAMPTYNPAPAYAPQPSSSPYDLAAYPLSGNSASYPQLCPSQYESAQTQYQPAQVQPTWNYAPQAWSNAQPFVNYAQPSWSYVQSENGQQSVLLGGPALAPPRVQQPTPPPSHSGPQSYPQMQQPHEPAPAYSMPSNQIQPIPQYAPQDYATQGYAPPCYGPQGYAPQGYEMQGYAMPGYPYSGASCDVWTDGYASIYGRPAAASNNWFGGVGGLWMTRDRSDHYTFSYGTLDEADQRTDTRNAAMGWTGGVDVRFGRYFNCQRNAIEAVYWWLSPVSQTTQTVSGDVLGNLNGILNWNSLDYAGTTADNFVNVAPGNVGIHQLTRDFAFQNLELNLWRFCGSCATGKCNCSRLRHNWLIGIRYFRFDESLLFASDANDMFITHENDELFYNIAIKNHLLGFQVGNEAQYCVTDRLAADMGIKLGIYGNRINHLSEIGGNLGGATINNGPFIGEPFWVSSSKNDVAFLGEVNLGLRYCFSRCWTGTIGYRALAVTGVAMPADQIYPDLRGINDVENIDSSRALILHGGYAGIVYNW